MTSWPSQASPEAAGGAPVQLPFLEALLSFHQLHLSMFPIYSGKLFQLEVIAAL